MGKITDEIAHARLDAYEQAWTHLENCLGDYYDYPNDKNDIEQTKYVINQLKRISKKFQDKIFGRRIEGDFNSPSN